jgi:ribonuclease T1
LAALAIFALLGGDLREDDGPSTESQPTTSTVVEKPAGFSEEESDGIAATLAAIESGDLPFEQDGGTFQNREGLLPDRKQGYYREYTVVTPGSDDRGARRLVVGADGDTWYTRDHYDSFVQIDPEKFR